MNKMWTADLSLSHTPLLVPYIYILRDPPECIGGLIQGYIITANIDYYTDFEGICCKCLNTYLQDSAM